MVDLAEIQAVYYMVAATGVLVAAAYYVLNMRAAGRNKKIELSNNILGLLYNTDTLRDMGELLNYKWTDFEDFLSKYDSTVDPDSFARRNHTFSIFETLGYLLKEGLIDRDLAYINGGMGAIHMWSKFKPVIEGYRRVAYGADMSAYFEYFASEMWRIKRVKDPAFSRDQTIGLEFDEIFHAR